MLLINVLASMMMPAVSGWLLVELPTELPTELLGGLGCVWVGFSSNVPDAISEAVFAMRSSESDDISRRCFRLICVLPDKMLFFASTDSLPIAIITSAISPSRLIVLGDILYCVESLLAVVPFKWSF